MKKLGAILLVIGILVMAVGFGTQHYVENNEKIRMINAMTGVVTPKLAKQLLGTGINVVGFTYTLDDALKQIDAVDSQAAQIRTGMRMYAYSPEIKIGGGILAAAGIALLLIRRKKHA